MMIFLCISDRKVHCGLLVLAKIFKIFWSLDMAQVTPSMLPKSVGLFSTILSSTKIISQIPNPKSNSFSNSIA